MAVKSFSELEVKDASTNSNLVAITGSGASGQNLNVSLSELYSYGLPAGYKRLRYLAVPDGGNADASTPGYFINTGVVGGPKVGWHIVYREDDTATDNVVIGTGIVGTPNTRQWINDQSSIRIGWPDSSGGGSWVDTGIASAGYIVTADINYDSDSQANVTCTSGASYNAALPGTAATTTYELYMFADNGAGTAQYGMTGRIYACRITSDNKVVRSFIPALSPSNVQGMYDLVEGKFYTNAGTGTGWNSSDSAVLVTSFQDFIDDTLIDDYPTPDSPNLVKASGVEAGMKQIREALMVDPMFASAWNNLASYTWFLNTAPSMLQNCVVGAKGCRSAFYNFGNTTESKSSISAAAVARKWVWTYYSGQSIGYPYLGSGQGNLLACKSTYYNGGAAYWLNQAVHPNAGNTDFFIRYNYNSPTSFGQKAYYTYKTLRCTIPNTELLNFNIPASASIANIYIPVFLLYSHYSYNNDYVLYENEKYKNFYLYCIFSSNKNDGGFWINTNYPTYIDVFCYLVRGANRAIGSNRTIHIGINDKYFSKTVDGTAPTQQTGTATTTTSSNQTIDLTTGITTGTYVTTVTITDSSSAVIQTITQTYTTTCTKSARSVVVTYVETDGTDTQTTTYTLLPDTDTTYGSDCAAFRNSLWNTTGVDGTSTGLLDGVYQVGTNKGTVYSYHWALDLRPVTEA